MITRKATSYEQMLEKRQAARARAIKKQREKQSCPKEIEKLKAKAAQKRKEKILKFNSEEEVAKRKVKAAQALDKARTKLSNKKLVSTKKKPINTRGMKGRKPTAEEKRIADKIGRIGCICCIKKGWYSTAEQAVDHIKFISLHHVEGRTKPWCHAMVLPLCQYHHDVAPPPGAPDKLFPIHGGQGRKLWEAINGSEGFLLELVYSMIEEDMPWTYCQ